MVVCVHRHCHNSHTCNLIVKKETLAEQKKKEQKKKELTSEAQDADASQAPLFIQVFGDGVSSSSLLLFTCI